MTLEEQDHHLAKRVTELIEADDVISIEQLHVHVQMGVMTLSGNVQSVHDKEHAELLARSVEGSVAVTNEIHVTGVKPSHPNRPHQPGQP